LVGFRHSTNIQNRGSSLSNSVKKIFAKGACPNAMAILGGPHATFMYEQILNEEAAVDIIVRGEGEQTLLELVQSLWRKRRISHHSN